MSANKPLLFFFYKYNLSVPYEESKIRQLFIIIFLNCLLRVGLYCFPIIGLRVSGTIKKNIFYILYICIILFIYFITF